MEANLAKRLTSINTNTPEMKKSLEVVQFLKSKRENGETEPFTTHFELEDTLYARAKIEPSDEVNMWLGVCIPTSSHFIFFSNDRQM